MSSIGRGFAIWLRRHGFAVRLAGCFLYVALATVFVGVDAENDLIWVANGVLLAYLLLAPLWRWPAYLAVGFAAQTAGCALLDPAHWRTDLVLSTVNLVEVVISAQCMRRRSAQLPRFTDRRYLLRFLGYAVLTGPLVAGILFAISCIVYFHSAPWPQFRDWVVTDALGISIATPACVAIFRTRMKSTAHWRRHWAYPGLLAVVAVAAFSQTRVPLLFLIYPLLILVLLRLGLGWASLSALFVAVAGSWYTLRGIGPFTRERAFGPSGPSVLLQLHIASGIFMLYMISVVLDRQRATEHRLHKIVSLHQLVTENSRDVIILADFEGNRSFVSRASYAMGGWQPEELIRFNSIDLVHPDDKPMVARVLRELRNGPDGAMLECRARKRSGDYVWVEANLRVVRDPVTGLPSGILNMMRDVSARKAAEQLREFSHSLISAILGASLDGILVVDGGGYVVSHNKRFLEVWKVPDVDTPTGTNEVGRSIPDDRLLAQCVERTKDPAGFLKRVQEIYADPNAIDHCEIEMRDGRTLERYSTSLRSESGQSLGRVWFFRDITARRRAEQELQDAYRAVEALAVTDPLTHLANRRRLDQCMSSEWRRGLRERTPLSFLLVDVDHFKSYNDTYGHLRGDSCLKQIAEAAQDVVTRPGDLVARFGGEEFAIVLPNTSNEGALDVAEQVCAAVRRRNLTHDANPLGYLTISVGCATMIPALGQHAATLIQKADDALYLAKRSGRNQVSNANAATPATTALRAS